MIRVGVLGATGRMGRQVLRVLHNSEDLQLVAAVSASNHGQDAGEAAGLPACGVQLGGLEQLSTPMQVLIDFSLPVALKPALLALPPTVALVSGTTGLSDEVEAMVLARSEQAPVLRAANFSAGVNVLLALVEKAAAALPDLDIEIIETHHRRKVDSPSGTALALASSAAKARSWDLADVRCDSRSGLVGARPHEQIGIVAVRGGDVVGEHDVCFFGGTEELRLSHRATDRSVFAEGAVRAARWLVGQPRGAYEMADVLGLRAAFS